MQIDNAVRIAERQRPQHHGIDDAEDGGRRTNANDKRADGGDCERTRTKQLAQRVGCVLPDRIDVHGAILSCRGGGRYRSVSSRALAGTSRAPASDEESAISDSASLRDFERADVVRLGDRLAGFW